MKGILRCSNTPFIDLEDPGGGNGVEIYSLNPNYARVT